MKEWSNKLWLKRRWIGGLCLLIACVAASWLILTPKEPSYQGKTLTEWQDDLVAHMASMVDMHPGANGRNMSYGAALSRTVPLFEVPFQSMGTNTFPFLLCQIQAKDSDLESRIARIFHEHEWQSKSFRSAVYRQEAAALSLIVLKQKGYLAVPEMLNLARNSDEETRERIFTVCARMGVNSEEYLKLLVAELQGSVAIERINAINCIVRLGGKAKVILPELQRLSANEEKQGKSDNSLKYAIQVISE